MDIKRLKLLLIEDNPGDARLIREMLVSRDESGIDIEHADSLSKGLELLEKNKYDAMLLDLNLPDSDGYATIQKTGPYFAQIPVIILTGMGDEDVATSAIKEGAQDYLPKSELRSGILARSINYAIQRKKSEEALKESEARYRTLIETSGEGIWAVDTDDKIVFVNNKQAEMLGYEVEEMIGRCAFDFLNEEARKIAEDNLKELRRNTRINIEARILRKDGAAIWISGAAVSLGDNRGGYAGSLGMLQDITERKKTEIRNKAKYELLNNLHGASDIDECLEYGCRAIMEADLFGRAVFTLHSRESEIMNIGQIGLESTEISAVSSSHAPDKNLIKEIARNEHRVGNSYFIPREEALSVMHTSLFIAPEDRGSLLPYEIGDALFIPVERGGEFEGWLAVAVPEGTGRPALDIVMFLEEIVGSVMQRVRELRHEEQLQSDRDALEAKNIALREVLSTIESEKLSIRKEVATTVGDKLLPAFKKLLKHDGTVDKSYYSLIKDTLSELAESTSSMLPISTKLSPRELEIVSLLKTGASSKDIAESLDVALVTVQKHREVIRKKLGLTNRSVNLTSFLRNLQSSPQGA